MKIHFEGQIKFIHLGASGPNLLTLKRQQQLISELDYENCKGVILLGNNAIFSAGLNLVDLVNANEDEVSEIFRTFINLLIAIRNFSGPVFSIVSGHAIAGGCLLALACDYRYGMFGFHRMGLNEMALSLDLPKSILSILSTTINPNFLFEIASQCKLYSPRQAFDRGLTNEYIRNPFIGKKKATELALLKAKKLANFYIDAGDPFCRLKKTFSSNSNFDHGVLVKNWFSSKTQTKVKIALQRIKK